MFIAAAPTAAPLSRPALRPSARRRPAQARRMLLLPRAEAADSCQLPADWADVPDEGKRRTLNLILAGALALPTAQMGYTYLSVLVPVK